VDHLEGCRHLLLHFILDPQHFHDAQQLGLYLDVDGLWLGFWLRAHDQSLQNLLLLWVHFVLCNLLLQVTKLHDLLQQLSPLLVLARVALALKVLEDGQ
jgi:hypothetical protein